MNKLTKLIVEMPGVILGAHKAATEQVNRYYAHGASKNIVEFVTEEVPIVCSSYVARFVTSLAFPKSVGGTQ